MMIESREGLSGVFALERGAVERRRMNITPLIDVVFLLLIFFMVTTTFRTKIKLFEVNLPRAKRPAIASVGKTTNVTITADGLFFVEDKNVSLADLRQKIEESNKGGREILLIRGDRRANYQNIIRVIDISRDIGIKKIVLLTEQTGTEPDRSGTESE